jgi:UDP-N-acetylmuramate-alanine ligase
MKNQINMIKLELDDSRRLTGKGILWDLPGAVIDAFVHGINKQIVVDCWQKHVTNLLDGVGWSNEQTIYRIFEDGITVALSAPFDALYCATEVNEAAWALTCDELLNQTVNSLTEQAQLIDSLTQMIKDEVNPLLLALIDKAQALNLPWLSDDDDFSLGFGETADIWLVNNLPQVNEVDWSKYRSIPIAMITGTNGKSTSVRLASQIFKQAGKCCGVTSTDFIRVGDDIIDRGDFSGPGGARTLLRNKAVDVALLEIARGGILRRGLPIPKVDAALITNIAEDHLGQYGINTLEGLTETKFVVAKALSEDGTLVLNADDPEHVRVGPSINHKKCWFSCDKSNPVLVAHLANGGAVCYTSNGQMVYQDAADQAANGTDIVAINDVPMTFNGAAVHNIQNALGAIGLAKSMGIADKDIAQALATFRSDVDDNPGRGNVFEVKGATVVMDFAHNEHSMKAIACTTKNMPSKRKFVMLSSAGDRSDKDITLMTQAALIMQPDQLVIAELEIYLRGRELGDIPAIVGHVALEQGMAIEAMVTTIDPVSGAKLILDQLQSGDLALLLVLSARDEVVELIKQYQ